MLPKEDRKALLLRLYNDSSPLVDHSKERFAKQTLEPSNDIIDAELEVAAVANQEDRIKVAQARNDTSLCDEDEEDEIEEGGVVIDPLAGEGIVTEAEGGGSGSTMENYG